MGVVSNQCANCGQWRGRGHVCPTVKPHNATPAEWPFLSPNTDRELEAGLAAARVDRVDRARAYIAELQMENAHAYIRSGAIAQTTSLTYDDFARFTAYSRDCDLNPDTPWRDGERETLKAALAPHITRDAMRVLPDGSQVTSDEAIDFIVTKADSDSILRDRLRLAHAYDLSGGQHQDRDFAIESAMLVVALHDEAKKDTQFHEARDWAVAVCAQSRVGWVTGSGAAGAEEVFTRTHEQASETHPTVSRAIEAYWWAPNAG